MNDFISLDHGSGGKASQNLIKKIFINSFGGADAVMSDSAILSLTSSTLAFTTDSFVVDPLFFPGGDIGKLAICGTVNDLAVSGAKPLYLTASFILEEGLSMLKLNEIVNSMAAQAKKANVKIVAGDTKVVPKGKCDKIYITTSGIGVLDKGNAGISRAKNVIPGDKIIINGALGNHAIAILGARGELGINSDIRSDCACLNGLIQEVIKEEVSVKFIRDITRGGLATVLNELADIIKLGIEIYEKEIPVEEPVKGVCEILGFDPLYLANEGKIAMVVSNEDAARTLEILKGNKLGEGSKIVGGIIEGNEGLVTGKTEVGGKRIINMLNGLQLPRIC